MIIADYPLGVGPNQYLIVANIGGYSSRADVAWNEANRAAPVHNTYYLVTAELGFLGLLGFVTVFFSAISLGLRSFKRLPSSERSDLAVGLTATLIVAAAHLAFEWAFATYYVQYVLAMSMGTLVGVTASLRQKSKSMKTSKTAAPAELVSQTG